MDTTHETFENLPADTEGLRALVLKLLAKLDEVSSERDSLQQQNDRIRHLLLKLKRMQFGAKSERLPEEQLQLGLEALEQAIAGNEAEAEKHDPKNAPRGGHVAVPAAVRCLRICRVSTSHSRRKTPTAPVAGRR